jgi:hypothetical protein
VVETEWLAVHRVGDQDLGRGIGRVGERQSAFEGVRSGTAKVYMIQTDASGRLCFRLAHHTIGEESTSSGTAPESHGLPPAPARGCEDLTLRRRRH